VKHLDMVSGIKTKDVVVGTGTIAKKGDSVTIRYDLTLNKGESIQLRQVVSFVVGKRCVIAGLEYGVQGMRVGGKRIIRVSPHLGYRDEGLDGLIPANAVLVFDVEMLEVQEHVANTDWSK
jgi:FKBP-type peptidyl-prolyl cis-trans isomerase